MDLKETFTTNSLPNNLEFLKVLAHVPFTTSKTELDIWYKKPHVWVASRITKRLTTWGLAKLGNVSEL